MTETTVDSDAEQERIVAMMRERGIDKPREILAMLGDYNPSAILGAIKWWDDLPAGKRGTGLLVHKINKGGMIGYKRPHEREGPGGELIVTDQMIARIRANCLTPDGTSREEIRSTYEKLADRAVTTVDALIDSAVDALWQETPPHPAMIVGHEAPADEPRNQRYVVWVQRGDDKPDRPDPTVQRRDGEGLWKWSCRFWRWTDPPELRQQIEKWRHAREMAAHEEALATPLRTAPYHDPKPESPPPEQAKPAEPDPPDEAAAEAEAAEVAYGDERWGEDAPF